MTERLPQIKPRQMVRALERDGWQLRSTRSGSHQQFKHPTKSGKVTVPFHGSKDLDRGTVRSIIEQAGLTEEQLKELL